MKVLVTNKHGNVNPCAESKLITSITRQMLRFLGESEIVISGSWSIYRNKNMTKKKIIEGELYFAWLIFLKPINFL